jgi:hypothetical protein
VGRSPTAAHNAQRGTTGLPREASASMAGTQAFELDEEEAYARRAVGRPLTSAMQECTRAAGALPASPSRASIEPRPMENAANYPQPIATIASVTYRLPARTRSGHWRHIHGASRGVHHGSTSAKTRGSTRPTDLSFELLVCRDFSTRYARLAPRFIRRSALIIVRSVVRIHPELFLLETERVQPSADRVPHSEASMIFQIRPSSPVGVKFPVMA